MATEHFNQVIKGNVMKLKGFILAALFCVTGTQAAQQKVIYGDDNRRDVYEESDTMLLELAKSTAALISTRGLSDDGQGMMKINGRKLGQARNFCADEPYGNQIAAANCSGFLVAPNVLVTAGHCVRSLSDCKNYNFVFDFKTTHSGQTEYKVPKSSVYSCKKVVKTVLNNWGDKMDYAVIELDRKVTDRAPLKYRTSGKVANGEDLVVIGHPSGLPTKIADGAYVRNNSQSAYFSANLDTYGGNSGSAVFNSRTGVIEGILVRGETDYARNGSCTVSYRCSNDGCRGEDVTRITNVAEILN
ncbi:MAG: peptidase [Halobacteriovoraceae bacterium]|nr:peptidase [Halobacteriovoraceae bacterium]